MDLAALKRSIPELQPLSGGISVRTPGATTAVAVRRCKWSSRAANTSWQRCHLQRCSGFGTLAQIALQGLATAKVSDTQDRSARGGATSRTSRAARDPEPDPAGVPVRIACE